MADPSIPPSLLIARIYEELFQDQDHTEEEAGLLVHGEFQAAQTSLFSTKFMAMYVSYFCLCMSHVLV